MHLRFSAMAAAFEAKENRHPQVVMKELGITYQDATPQSIADQWWFWNCENIPEKLPVYLTELTAKPMECIGYGLSKEQAERITSYSKPDSTQ